jgi:hypothetical protein
MKEYYEALKNTQGVNLGLASVSPAMILALSEGEAAITASCMRARRGG